MARKTKKKISYIYCGPSIPGGVLQRYMIAKHKLPDHLNNLFEKCPSIRALFIPVDQLSKTKKAIPVKGTVENALYNNVLQFIKKGGV